MLEKKFQIALLIKNNIAKECRNCGSMNENRVNIAYLDTVKLFEPGRLKMAVTM